MYELLFRLRGRSIALCCIVVFLATWIFLIQYEYTAKRTFTTHLMKSLTGRIIETESGNYTDNIYCDLFEDVSEDNKDPFLTLDPDRFLYAVLRWGPNNQLFGFHDAVILSIALNRTVVLPMFYKHYRDRQNKGASISPAHRIDTEILCEFVSCVTLDTFQTKCNSHVDAVLNTKILDEKTIHKFEEMLDMGITLNGSTAISEILLPRSEKTKENLRSNFTVDEAKNWFNSSARCVLYVYPMFDMQTYIKGKRWKLHDSVRKNYKIDKSPTTGKDLYTSVMQHYKRPPYIRKLSEDFIKNILEGQQFLSVHWRYNKKDYLSSVTCNKNKRRKLTCNRANNFTAEEFAARIVNKISQLKAKNFEVGHIYIATPLNELKIIDKVSTILHGNKNWKTFTSVQLTEFIKESQSKCDFLEKHIYDIISTTEMEICSRGIAFLRSESSWSANVVATRNFGNISGIQYRFDDTILPT